ncbi:TRAP transporter small permease [Pseudooceanicola sediminis]|uniref:TRAP transporter small permease protein n=1 Tax=Pseudooceanicola sediminis TaxID=2211117 RepID=A0A399IYY7_9RHOB|nr:TRAP transporter small permease [Pseudooceanicola sediminis]KAA2316110.1 TRAP transporter small permease [Puniceibacterium sp. HSS470]RII38220.1 TRAP transporter small permease [Pseudooceanicola sediminis]|tara:strand:+ start:17876 stop:18541 length:666 start_codon:yes stop_codon:yes gene_type:complete
MQAAPEGSFTDRIEETLIAVILGVMTLVTFANVIARYVFNSNILWALEGTVFLFGWMVLLGASYAVKKNAHLGVDAVIEILPAPARRVLALISVVVCIAFTFLLLKGAWDYWANFANLPQTTGRWFPTGFEETFRPKGWYEVNDIPFPEWLGFVRDVFNDGDEYEKLPRFIPYAVLPLSMTLILLRFCQAAWAVWCGRQDRIVASHEVEDEIADVRRKEEA